MKIINGGTPKSNVTSFWNGDIPWITPKDMGKLQTKYTSSTLRNITEDGLKNSSAKIVPRNSVILSTRAPIGYLAINKVEMSFNQGCKGLVPNNNINPEYLFYFLTSCVEMLNKLGTGATFKEISTKKLQNLEIPVPSLQEQEKIVERLDKVFRTNEKSIKLKKSISDKFIGYYKLKINDLFTQLEEEITISNFVNDSKKDIVDGPFGSNLKREHFVSSGIEVLKLQDIKENNIHKKSKDYVTKDKFLELKRHSFKPNDLILTKLGNPLGICAIIKDQEGLIVADLLRVRCKNLLDAKFLMYQINSLGFQKIINSFQRGATRPRIRISDFRDMKIKTCSNKEKIEIVELIEKLDSLKTQYLSNNKTLIDNYLYLITSVLNKEFSYE